MSTVRANTILDAAGGNTATINGMTPTAQSLQGFRNRIINGDMRIDQRNAGASVSASGSVNQSTFGVDRWATFSSSPNRFTMQQNAGSVTPPSGFINYQGITSTSAYTPAAGETSQLYHNIEGFNSADLMWGTASAQPVTVSFWVRSSLTGNFGGAITNEAQNRSYPFLFAISAANTWEQKVLAIPGDTSGTWVTGNGRGITLIFDMATGANFKGTAGVWAAANLYSATGAISVFGTNGATFYITGVQLEAGSVATPFERRDYGRELIMCQRYYEQSAQGNDFIWLGYCSSGTSYYLSIPYKVTKRSTPTITISSPGGNAFNTASLTAGDINVENFNAACPATGTSVGGFFYVRYKASAEL